MQPLKASALADPEFKADPYPFYARLRKEAPLCLVKAGPLKATLVTRYEDVVVVLKDDRVSKDVTKMIRWMPKFLQPLTHSMLNRDPPEHTRLRMLVSQAFSSTRIEPLREKIQRLCTELLSDLPADGQFDLVRDYALPIPLTIISELLGIPESQRAHFHVLARRTMPLGAPSRVMDFVQGIPFAWRLLHYFRKLFADRRAEPKDDLLSALVQAEQDGDRLSEDELLGMAVLLLFAGYETTVNLIASGALALLEHPTQREIFMSDAEPAATVIDELLRYTSPVEMGPPRVALEKIVLNSGTVSKGEYLIPVLGSANHDESQFQNPETLDLYREPNKHLAFGHGVHFCLGAHLAQLEARIALTTLFKKYPALMLSQPSNTLRWRKMLPIRGLEALPVRSQS